MGGVLRDQAGPCQNILEPLTTIHPTKLIFNKQLSRHLCVSEACVVRVGTASEGAAGAISGYGNWLKEAWRETAQGEGVARTPDAQVLVLALPLTPCETRGRSLPQSELQSSHLWNESVGPIQLGRTWRGGCQQEPRESSAVGATESHPLLTLLMKTGHSRLGAAGHRDLVQCLFMWSRNNSVRSASEVFIFLFYRWGKWSSQQAVLTPRCCVVSEVPQWWLPLGSVPAHSGVEMSPPAPHRSAPCPTSCVLCK